MLYRSRDSLKSRPWGVGLADTHIHTLTYTITHTRTLPAQQPRPETIVMLLLKIQHDKTSMFFYKRKGTKATLLIKGHNLLNSYRKSSAACFFFPSCCRPTRPGEEGTSTVPLPHMFYSSLTTLNLTEKAKTPLNLVPVYSCRLYQQRPSKLKSFSHTIYARTVYILHTFNIYLLIY